MWIKVETQAGLIFKEKAEDFDEAVYKLRSAIKLFVGDFLPFIFEQIDSYSKSQYNDNVPKNFAKLKTMLDNIVNDINYPQNSNDLKSDYDSEKAARKDFDFEDEKVDFFILNQGLFAYPQDEDSDVFPIIETNIGLLYGKTPYKTDIYFLVDNNRNGNDNRLIKITVHIPNQILSPSVKKHRKRQIN